MKENNNIKTDLSKGVYIPSIDCSWLKKFNEEIGDYEINEEYLDKLLNGKLDFSFELIANKELLKGIEIKEFNGKLYTLDIVNVTFDKKYTQIDKATKKATGIEMATKELRDWAYEDGFKFNNKQMSNWKRSTGKSRIGENMFIIDDIKDKCVDWSRMELKFVDESKELKVDIGSIRAYESLPLSSIIGTIEINPENILVIEDFKSTFKWEMSNTYLVGKELVTKTEIVDEENSIWDGQGLLSNKVFEANKFLNGKGVALLRNRFMKSAAMATYIELFFIDYCESKGIDYDNFEVTDMYGNIMLAKDVLFITTPSSIKLAKYNDIVLKVEDYENLGVGAWLEYWKDNCGTTFGVCKYDKPSYNCIFDEEGNVVTYRNVLSYQMTNTIPFTKEELHNLVAPEIKYVNRLKNDLEFFFKEIKQEASKIVDVDSEDEIDKEFKVSAEIDTVTAFIELAKRTPKFECTQVFKDYRRNFINAYIKKLRQGKIHVNNMDYAIACGNPIEMLKASVGDWDKVTSVLNGNELFCSRFTDGEKIVGFRNPHIMVSNCGVQVNKYCEEIDKYMYVTDGMVYLNSIDYPTLSIYSGEDFDIDSNLFTSNKEIVDACSRIQITKNESDIRITPVAYNGIKNTGKNDAVLTGKNMSKIDNTICQNFIGSDINLSQEINSKMNNAIYNNLLSDEKIGELFDMVSKCSSISQCEIDKSKKQFEDLNVNKELRKMKDVFELVDDDKVRALRKDIISLKEDLYKKNIEISEERKPQEKPFNSRIRNIKNILRINEAEKLSDEEILELENIIKKCDKELSTINKSDKELRKQFNQDKRKASKMLREDKIKKLSNETVAELAIELFKCSNSIATIYEEKQSEINEIEDNLKLAKEELNNLDKRRVKPYFFKFIGDNDAMKQRAKTNKKHRKELDTLTIEGFAKAKGIEVDQVDMKDKELVELLKANKDVQEDWEMLAFNKEIDTPMNWLQKELDSIAKKEDGKTTIPVIKLVKDPKKKADDEVVNKIVKIISDLDVKVKGYRTNTELSYRDRQDKIALAKDTAILKIGEHKLTKVNMYGVLKACLNSVKKNGECKKKSGIESISLEILFKTFGFSMLRMFM